MMLSIIVSRHIAAALVLVLVLSSFGIAEEGSSSTVSVPISTSTSESGTGGETSSALLDLNYKLEILQERFIRLNKDIEDLRLADREQRRLLNEQILYQPDSKKIQNLVSETALLRSELGQVREDISVLNSKIIGDNPPQGEYSFFERYPVFKSPWMPVAAIGISVLAIIFAAAH